MLAGFAAFAPAALIAAEPTVPASSTPQDNSLPDLGTPARTGSASVLPSPNGISVQGRYDGTKITIAPEYSDRTGVSLGAALATMLGDRAAVGVLLTGGADKKELLLNAGFKLDERQRFIVSAGQLKQFLDYAFVSGNEKAGMTQNSGGVSYQLQLGKEFLRYLEVNGYISKTASRDLADKTFAVDTATLYELWNDPRRIAGGKVGGLQGKLGFSPINGSTVKVSFGYEHLSYDLLAGSDSVNRPTAGLEWQQQIGNGYQLKIGAESFAAQNRYSIGVDRSLVDGGGRHNIGLNLIGLRGRDGLGNDQQLQLTYSYVFGAGAVGNLSRAFPAVSGLPGRLTPSHATQSPDAAPSAASFGGDLLDQVAQRPSFIPGQVLAKVDTTALPTRLIAVDKTALPAATTINTATGDVTVPLGVTVTGIAGVTRNLAPFANNSQFALTGGNSLIIRPSQIVQPAVSIVDTYVVTLNNLGSGTTLVTVQVSHGSVKIDSIVVSTVSNDLTAPTTTGAPAVSATTYSGTTLSATIDEAGTGYYLVQPAAASAPTVAAVQAGSSFAMSANVAASLAITGLSASTAYKVYFVAKDAANNVQGAVQSVAVTTIAEPDVTAPSTTAAPAVSATTDTGTTLSVTINEAGTGYYLVQPAAVGAPSVAAVQVGTSFAMTANTSASVAISGLTASTAYKVYFVAKDAANNVQAAVQNVAVTTIATPDTTAPSTTAAPSVSSTTDTGTTLSVTINEAGTGYYLVQPAAASAPTVAAVQAGSGFAMIANVAASLAITGLSASTAYKVYFVAKDAVNNVQAAVQSVAVTTIATPDTTAPTTTAAPAISVAATDTTVSVTQTINETGTGYYLLLPAASAAPTVAAVKAGTSFAMTANTPAVVSLTGLTASTAYKYYFVAKDAVNNDQAAVSAGLAITTTAAADTTPAAFAFTDLSNQNVSTPVESNAITVAGINTSAPISVTGGEYQINGGAWTGAAGTVSNGQTVKVRHTTSASNGTAINTVLTIGGVSDTFTSTTTASLPSGYISQGGLTWMPNNIGPWSNSGYQGNTDWNTANSYCSTATNNGQTGWRLPTQAELSSLYSSGALAGQGWMLDDWGTWSSTSNGAGSHLNVYLNSGTVSWGADTDNDFVTCVRWEAQPA